MPTYNSSSTIRLALESIAKQTIDANLVEALVIDGGSSDDTRAIAAQFGCRIIDNERVQPEYAKLLGLAQARGKYAMFLDSDEVLCDPESLGKKVALLRSHLEVKNVITAGLRNPPGYPAINDYTNRFGEPFSYFMYRLDGGDYVPSLKHRYNVAYEGSGELIVTFEPGDVLPICDGGGHFFDLEYLKGIADTSRLDVVPMVFSLMAEHTHSLAVIKDDYVLHYSTTSLKRYLNKIRWRVVANVHRATGTEGFANRERLQPLWFRLRKYLFVLYAVTLIGPLADAIYLSLSRKTPGFMLHFPVAVYTGFLIVAQYALKLLGAKPRITNYGE